MSEVCFNCGRKSKFLWNGYCKRCYWGVNEDEQEDSDKCE